jgi:uncharacterized protein
MEPDKIDYPALLQQAFRDVVRQALAQVAQYGLPGAHYFQIAFRTDAPGVEIPRFLRDQYPQQMRIDLEHQFWDLEVTQEAFSVVLSFGGSRQLLIIPFAALTAFADPSADFGVRLGFLPRAEETASQEASVQVPGNSEEDSEVPGGVLRFDPSRKR